MEKDKKFGTPNLDNRLPKGGVNKLDTKNNLIFQQKIIGS